MVGILGNKNGVNMNNEFFSGIILGLVIGAPMGALTYALFKGFVNC